MSSVVWPHMRALRRTNVSQASSGMHWPSPGSFAKLDQEVCRLLGEIMRESKGLLLCVMLCTAFANETPIP